jgi:hypothetical protein
MGHIVQKGSQTRFTTTIERIKKKGMLHREHDLNAKKIHHNSSNTFSFIKNIETPFYHCNQQSHIAFHISAIDFF